ncbi:MAG: 50S ribosomal protein L25/general stress protein Ctc [Chlorobi bacterium]|nr:50S ribosomal protein L25/general stress protein Ctc [Chlorobiota bacterium]
MQSIELKGNIRENVGNKYAKKLRKENLIPCVLYGGKENVHFSIHKNDFRHIIYTPNTYIAKLDIDGKKYTTILKDHQFHPVTDEVLHADFLEIFDDKKVTINVPIKLVGSSIGIKNGGKLRQKRRTLKIMALPKYLLDHVEIDITNIDIGKTLKVGELDIENIEILDPHQSMIISVVSPRVAAKGMELEEDTVKEGEEEGEEETAAEGTAPESESKEKPSE